MINSMKPLALCEVKEIVEQLEEKKELKDYLKKFGNLSNEVSVKLMDELEKLDNMKIKKEHIVKIVDFFPKTSEDLNKIFSDVSLDEKEVNEVLEIIGRY